MAQQNIGRKVSVAFDENTAAAHSVIAAPGSGKHIEIDMIALNPDGGANNVTLGAVITPIFRLNDNQGLVFDFAANFRPLECADNTAFTITLSAATAVSGFVLYRIVGEY